MGIKKHFSIVEILPYIHNKILIFIIKIINFFNENINKMLNVKC